MEVFMQHSRLKVDERENIALLLAKEVFASLFK